MIYRELWQRNVPSSLACYVRDLIVQWLPFKLPRFIRRTLYGRNVRFVFVVHPRRKDDIFIAAPFLSPLRKYLPSKLCYKIIQMLPASVLCTVTTEYGVTGVVVYKLSLPETMLSERKKCLKESHSFLRFASKISERGSFIGLGGWWPIVTRRGLGVQAYAKKVGLKLTNGHTGTLCSMYLAIEKIAYLGGEEVENLNILVIGGGKMGSNVINVIKDKVAKITIIDRHANKLSRLINDLKKENSKTTFHAIDATDESIKLALIAHDICICTTSNLRRIIKPDELPRDTIVIDDSRPEAFPRVYNKNNRVVVLEGGLMKIPGANCGYDFGFGLDDNFFGCLAETFLLAYDSRKHKVLRETIGDVDQDNFRSMIKFCKENLITLGDLKSSNLTVEDSLIRHIIGNKKRTQRLAEQENRDIAKEPLLIPTDS